jgi:hypothetical protein
MDAGVRATHGAVAEEIKPIGANSSAGRNPEYDETTKEFICNVFHFSTQFVVFRTKHFLLTTTISLL